MALHSRVVCDPSELARWRGAWRELLRRSASDEPTRSPLWLGAWWRVFGGLDGRKLRVALFLEGDRLVGIAPLLGRRKWHFPAIPFERLELLGSGEPEADEVCSDHLGLVAERDHEAPVAEALVRELLGGALGPWDELLLPGLDADDPTLPALERAFAQAGIAVERTITGACPYVALPRSFDDYLALLRSEQRYLVRRSLRDFERWAAGESELHCVKERSELEAGKRVLEVLHRERWNAEGRTGVFDSPRFRAFHDDVMAALLDEAALDLSWLSVRGRPIAAAYSLVWNGKVHFYQSGRTLDVPKGIRPGIVLHALAIRRAIERGLREYDFLAGTSQYKLELATGTRPIARLRAVRSRLKESARGAAERGVDRVRWLRDAVRSALPGRLAEARPEPR
jgi:CelD/BcsL family acetyltransferase involved in cellulose biosynthesis